MTGVVCACRTQLGTSFHLFFAAVIPRPGVCESWISSSARQTAKVLTLELSAKFGQLGLFKTELIAGIYLPYPLLKM